MTKNRKNSIVADLGSDSEASLGGGRRSEWCGRPWSHRPRCGKREGQNELFKLKKKNFCLQKYTNRWAKWTKKKQMVAIIFLSLWAAFVINSPPPPRVLRHGLGLRVVATHGLIKQLNTAVLLHNLTILTLWRRNFLLNFSTPVFKMWIIQEPKKVALWNKRHFEERKKTEIMQHV